MLTVVSPRKLLADAGCILTGEYFVAFKSGRVGCTYINVDPLFTFPRSIALLGEMLVQSYEWSAATIAGPAMGGVPLIYAAAARSRLSSVRTAWADKESDGTFTLGRMGFAGAIKNQPTLVVEDVTTTGSSAKSVGELVERHGGKVIAYSFIWNRGGVTEEQMGAPVHSLINESLPSWAPGEHEMWGKWPLVTDLGHPDKFPNYPGPRIKLLDI